MVYREPGIFFDDFPNAAFSNSSKIPSLIRAVAVEKFKFKSRVKNFKAYDSKDYIFKIKTFFLVLPTPSVHYNSIENMLKIETIPGIIYKYTLDGTTPTYNSSTCSG